MIRSFWLIVYYIFACRLPGYFFPGGKLFNRLRCFVISRILPAMGSNVRFNQGVYIGRGENVRIGSNSHINEGAHLANVEIGENVLIAPEVYFIARTHRCSDPHTPVALQGEQDHPATVVANGAWIGLRAVIMPGLRIGEGAIVGALSLVNRDVPDFCVVGGVPARVIRNRLTDSPSTEAGAIDIR
ncbi:acyltransferase [Candidatus Fermentibacteria bacterium]|nr:acyltransferase [Candidatus Fermentibacteria bacterium]